MCSSDLNVVKRTRSFSPLLKGPRVIDSLIDSLIHLFTPPHRTAPLKKIAKILIIFVNILPEWRHFLRFFHISSSMASGPYLGLNYPKCTCHQKYSHLFYFNPKFLKIFMWIVHIYISNTSFVFVCICLSWPVNMT